MPYAGASAADTEKIDVCVTKVMGQGHDKSSAIGICRASIEGKEYNGPPLDFTVQAVGDSAHVLIAGVTIKQCGTLREASEWVMNYKATADINNLPDSAFLHVETGGNKDEGNKTVPRSLRHLPYRTSSGAIDLPKLRNALSRLGQSDTGTAGGEKWLTESLRKSLVSKAEKLLSDNTDAASAKKETTPTVIDRLMSFIRGDDSATKEQHMTTKEESINQFQSRIYGAFNKQFPLPQSSNVYTPTPYIVDCYPDHIIIGYSDDYYSVTLMDDGSTITFKPQLEWVKVQSKQEWIEKSTRFKEGRRNATTDQGRLQTIHDLSVENGAACPMVLKQANGQYRWILLSTNTYQDRDGEIVSQAAQESDVERMTTAKQYGPLRLWHLGYPDVTAKEAGPGIDVGDCDYSQMFGKIRVESGTFRDERTAAAIKGRADQWAGSIGFFHPIDQPDQSGVYAAMHTFERSLLPRGKASNYLTPLAAIVKENDMTTKEDKVKQLTDLLGDASLAEAVLKQVDATEKAAQERGLKFKEDAATDKAAKPKVEKGSAAEEGAEPKAKAAAEPDYEAMAKGLAPHFEKMIKAHLSAAKEAQATKETGLQTALDQVTAQLKETRAIVNQLNGDLPRGVRDAYRATRDDNTVTTDPKFKDQSPPVNPLASTFNWLTSPMAQYTAPPPLPPVPEK